MKALIKSVCIALFLITTVVSNAHSQNPKGAVEVIILHVNDMHSKIDNMGKLAWVFDSLKTVHPHVFLIAAGDNFTGNPVVDMVEDKGYPMVDLMNLCGFTFSAIGNHEFDMGQEMFNKRRKQAKFPFISCNFDASGAVVKQPEPYFILEAGKAKIPFLGIIQLGVNGIPDSHPSKLEGIKFTNGIEKAQEFKWLKKKYGSLIGLTHLGIEDDVPLAQKMPEFDIIIGGHSHTFMKKPLFENGVMIVQTGSGLRSVGKTSFVLKKKKIVSRNYEAIDLATITKSKPEVQAKIDFYNSNEELSRVVATALTPFDNEDELGYLMTDAITTHLKTDFAFQNGGGIRIPNLPQGDIRLKDVYRLDPFGNQVVVFKMNLNEIKSLIINAYNRDKSIDLVPSGLMYTVKTDATGKCTDVELTDMNGSGFILDKIYTVGINSYISASYKFDHSDPGITQPITTAETLINYLKEKNEVGATGKSRVKVLKL